MQFGDYEVAAQMRSVLETLITKVVDYLRPVPQYGQLVSIDYMSTDNPNPLQPEAMVDLPGDPGAAVPYKVMNQPFRLPGKGEGVVVAEGSVGNAVRVDGPNGDRYILPMILPDLLEGPSRISVCEREPEVKRVNDLWCPTGDTYPGSA